MRRRLCILCGTILFASLLAVATAACGHAPSSATNAWVVSGGGAIWNSGDGGASWHKQSSRTTGELIGVAFCDAGHGGAVGMNSVILGTTDGGSRWVRENTHGPPLWRVVCVDSQHAWALGPAGTAVTLEATTDGGASWHQQLVHGATLKFGGGIAFADTRRGWLVSSGTIRATFDGGRRWVVQLRRSAYRLLAVTCSDADHVWAVGTVGDGSPLVLATSDGGARWVVQHVGPPGVDTTSGGYGLATVTCADSHHVWAAGLGDLVAVTANGGSSWQLRQLPASAIGGLAIACAGDSHVLMTTNGQLVMTSSNGGLNWSASGRNGWLPEGPAQGSPRSCRPSPERREST